jgi:YesN/AraC family two-component response regulator
MNSKQNNEIKARSIFAEIIHLLLRYNECKSYSFSDAKRAEEVINYLTKHYAEKITLEELSEKMQLSYSYLGSIFKKVTGKPIIEYLIHIRLYKAKELLRDGHSVSDVAYMTGFNDVFYFSKVFKKYEHISPSQYRRENINQ